MNDTNFTIVTLVLIKLNGAGMGDHHVVVGLENLGQVILNPRREFADQVLPVTNGTNFVESCPIANFWKFFKTESRIVHKVLNIFPIEEIAI